MAMLNNQTVCIMYMSIVSVTKKMQLSEILLEYVKTKCDDLNLFVGIAIVQICHFLVFKKNRPSAAPGPRPSCALALCRGSRSASELVSTATTFTPRALCAGGFFGCHRCSAVETTWRPWSTWTNLEKVQHLVIIFLLVGGDWNHGIL
jgi:hypothetical protein